MLLEGATSVVFQNDVYIFGGKDHSTGQLTNTVYCLKGADVMTQFGSVVPGEDGTALKLQHVECTGQVPSPRCFHAAALRSQFMVVIGGLTVEGSADAAQTSPDLIMFALNLESFVWSRYYVPPDQPTKLPPRPRCHATLVSTPKSLLLYGGFPTAEDGKYELNHWSVFEISSSASVSQIRIEGQHPLLWGHSAVFSHNCLMLFGGADGPACSEVASLCVFHPDERRWRWAEFPHAPEPRLLHTAVQYKGKMYVCGGFASHRQVDGTNPQFDDTWVFSLNTGLWERMEVGGLGPRSGHTACVVDNKMVVIGGLEGNELDLPSMGTIAIFDFDAERWIRCPMAVNSRPTAAVRSPVRSPGPDGVAEPFGSPRSPTTPLGGTSASKPRQRVSAFKNAPAAADALGLDDSPSHPVSTSPPAAAVASGAASAHRGRRKQVPGVGGGSSSSLRVGSPTTSRVPPLQRSPPSSGHGPQDRAASSSFNAGVSPARQPWAPPPVSNSSGPSDPQLAFMESGGGENAAPSSSPGWERASQQNLSAAAEAVGHSRFVPQNVPYSQHFVPSDRASVAPSEALDDDESISMVRLSFLNGSPVPTHDDETMSMYSASRFSDASQLRPPSQSPSQTAPVAYYGAGQTDFTSPNPSQAQQPFMYSPHPTATTSSSAPRMPHPREAVLSPPYPTTTEPRSMSWAAATMGGGGVVHTTPPRSSSASAGMMEGGGGSSHRPTATLQMGDGLTPSTAHDAYMRRMHLNPSSG